MRIACWTRQGKSPDCPPETAIPGHFHLKCLLSGTFMITTLRKPLALPYLKGLAELRLFLTKTSRQSHRHYCFLTEESSVYPAIQAISAIMAESKLGQLWSIFDLYGQTLVVLVHVIGNRELRNSLLTVVFSDFVEACHDEEKANVLSSPANRAN